MEEVGHFQNGERDYYQMKGSTGPLVYPAGFVYIFTVLKLMTGGDHSIAQIIFGFIYLVQTALVLLIAQPTANVSRNRMRLSYAAVAIAVGIAIAIAVTKELIGCCPL